MYLMAVSRSANPAPLVRLSRGISMPENVSGDMIVFVGKTRKVPTYRIGRDEVVRPKYLKDRGLRWDGAVGRWVRNGDRGVGRIVLNV